MDRLAQDLEAVETIVDARLAAHLGRTARSVAPADAAIDGSWLAEAEDEGGRHNRPM